MPTGHHAWPACIIEAGQASKMRLSEKCGDLRRVQTANPSTPALVTHRLLLSSAAQNHIRLRTEPFLHLQRRAVRNTEHNRHESLSRRLLCSQTYLPRPGRKRRPRRSRRSQSRRLTPGQLSSPISLDLYLLFKTFMLSAVALTPVPSFTMFPPMVLFSTVTFVVSGLSERPESVIRTARLSLFPLKVLLAT
jgi:hypothetical protein